MENIKEKYNLNVVFRLSVIASILIMIIHNLKIDIYIKDFILPIILLLISDYIASKKLDINTNKKAYIFLIPIVLILLNSFLFKVDISNMLLNIIVLPFLISMFFLNLINPNYKISRNILKWTLNIFPNKLFTNLQYIPKIEGKKSKDKSLNIFKGLILSIPIVGIIMVLLTSGDRYFEAFIAKLLNSFTGILNEETFIQSYILLMLWFIIIFSTFINLLLNKDKKDVVNKPTDVNDTTITTILSVVNLVFVVFLISEISKLTNNFLRLPIEYTYARYAREGFFQLLGVTVVNFIIIAYLLYYTTIIKDNKKIKYLLLTLITFSIILIFNSYYRMFLYISAYGFTILRLQVILFLAMELIIFILLIVKTFKKLEKDNIIFTSIIITTYILNLYLCNETFINLIS